MTQKTNKTNFTNTKLAEIHYLYRSTDENAYETKRLYQVRFKNGVVPDARTVSSTHRRLSETGCFESNHHLKGEHRTAITPGIEVGILNSVEKNCAISTRQV